MSSPPPVTRYLKSETRIAQLTLLLGAIAAIPVAYFHGWRWGLGIFIGAVFAWLNFRWLQKGLDALATSATAQSTQQTVNVPFGTYFRAAFRYLLIALAVYVIFKVLNVPVLSMIFGLCALGAATFTVSVHEILHSPD
ncbi:MAG TPA: ATP synthase subunit I [Candidatus Acidoferrum sp.]|jgi:small-conductance mechanosensitive channel